MAVDEEAGSGAPATESSRNSAARDVIERVAKAGVCGITGCPAWVYKVVGVIFCLQVGYFAYAYYRSQQDLEQFGDHHQDTPGSPGFAFDPKLLQQVPSQAPSARYDKRQVDKFEKAPNKEKEAGEEEEDEEEDKVLKFTIDHLLKYGYLTGEQAERCRGSSGGRRQELRAALRRYQRFMGLPETGHMDEETDQLMEKPRCGVKDLGADAIGDHYATNDTAKAKRWPDKLVTYKVLFYPSSERMPKKTFDLELRRAFKAWSQVTPLIFVASTTSDQADIEISFVQGAHNHCPGGPFEKRDETLAHAFAPGPEELGGSIHINDHHLWAQDSSEGSTLYSVVLHEIGHALGLGHSRNPEALMYATERDRGLLHQDDIKAVQALYGAREDRSSATTAAPTTSAAPSTTTTTSAAPSTTTTTTNSTAAPEKEAKKEEEEAKPEVPDCKTPGQWLFAGHTCRQFYDCRSGSAKLKLCPADLVWNKASNLCDQKHNVAECR